MDVVIYARYSSHNQTEASIEGQLEVNYKYCEVNNFNVVGVYVDRAKSGTKDDREDFLKMIEDSKDKNKTWNGIVVYQLDRFARNKYDSVVYKKDLKKNNVRVFSARENISEDASGVLMESVLEGMAEYYSVELGQKVKRGMDLNASKFLYTGSTVVLGFEINTNKEYVIDSETAPIMKEAFSMYDNNYTIEDVQDYINNQLRINNITYNKGKRKGKLIQYAKSAVRNLLSNKKYIGTYIYKGVETPNAIPRIIEDELFNSIQDRLEKNKHSPSRLKTTSDYLLTTKLFCGLCKDMMVGVSGTSRTGKMHYYYSCNKSRKKMCSKKNVQKDFIENLVIKEARSILTTRNIDKIAKTVVKLAKEEKDTSNVLNKLNSLLKANEKQKINLLDSLRICDIETVKKTIFEEIAKVEAENMELQNQIRIESSKTVSLDETQVRFFLTKIKNGSLNDIKYKKLLVSVLINKIYLYDDNMTIYFNTQDKVFESKVPTIEEAEVRIKNIQDSQI